MDQSREQQILVAFGAKLRSLRNERYLSLRDLEAKANVEFSFIGALERAEKTPSLITIIALAEGLEINPSVLVSELE